MPPEPAKLLSHERMHLIMDNATVTEPVEGAIFASDGRTAVLVARDVARLLSAQAASPRAETTALRVCGCTAALPASALATALDTVLNVLPDGNRPVLLVRESGSRLSMAGASAAGRVMIKTVLLDDPGLTFARHCASDSLHVLLRLLYLCAGEAKLSVDEVGVLRAALTGRDGVLVRFAAARLVEA